jgi:tetratricopeptide (TPR) repeat protein
VEDLRQAGSTVSVLTALGYAYAKGNNYVEAIKSFTQALCADSRCIVALHNRGNCYQHLFQHAEVTSPQAISDFSTEISLQPSSLAYFSRGLSYELQGASTKALSDYSKSLDLSSTE